MQAVEDELEPRIELRARIDRRSRPVLQVIDNGPGIPPDVQEKIFVPFFTTKEDGSGIGLSLSRQIMRLHGGALTVRSDPDSDAETMFTLRF
jgi:signal transduction histidine kinase